MNTTNITKSNKFNINTTIVKGIVCIKCGVTLPDMLMSEHLDITNPKNKMCGCIKSEMLKHQQNRLNVVSNWAMFLLTLDRSGKGQKTRREWLCYIQQGARTVFNTEQDEYEYIGKFGRGRWSKEFLEKGFSQDEIKMIVDFAKEYGAFDY